MEDRRLRDAVASAVRPLNDFTGPFRVLLADPPWIVERGSGRVKRGAQRYYTLLPTKAIPGVLLGSPLWRPHPDGAHLYLWSTNAAIPSALWVMEQVGFRYVTMLTWAKLGRFGLGRYFRGRTEQLLFGVQGPYLPPLCRTQGTLLEATRREHSRKPEVAYAAIEAVSPGPRVEFFARGAGRPGWATWGTEARPPTAQPAEATP